MPDFVALTASFLLFAIVSAITPGPNNLMVMSSGLNFGFGRSLPHIMGITLGFAAMVLIVGLGGNIIFTRWPIIYTLLRYGCAIYLIWLAYKIATSSPHIDKKNQTAPLSFMQAATFQWINPKAWVMSIMATTLYVPLAHYGTALLFIVLIYTLVTFPCVAFWAWGGAFLKKILHHPYQIRIINIVMGGLLFGSLYPLLME